MRPWRINGPFKYTVSIHLSVNYQPFAVIIKNLCKQKSKYLFGNKNQIVLDGKFFYKTFFFRWKVSSKNFKYLVNLGICLRAIGPYKTIQGFMDFTKNNV